MSILVSLFSFNTEPDARLHSRTPGPSRGKNLIVRIIYYTYFQRFSFVRSSSSSVTPAISKKSHTLTVRQYNDARAQISPRAHRRRRREQSIATYCLSHFI